MSSFFYVVIFSLIGGMFSLLGAMMLYANSRMSNRIAHLATPFAAGALLAAAFIDLLPEAAHDGDIEKALYATLGGIVIFFLLERFLRWFHHHDSHNHASYKDPKIPLIVIGDTLHNFIDGIAIAAGFLIDPVTGIVVTFAVAAHEIPQEIGDFGLLLQKGMPRKKVFWVNILSALATTAAAIVFYTLGNSVGIPLDIILGIVAGFFIYIAVSDIIPSIHENEKKVFAGPQTWLLLLGIVIVGVATTLLHGIIE